MASSAVTAFLLPLIFVLMDFELPCYSSLLLHVRLMYVIFSIWCADIIQKELVEEDGQGIKLQCKVSNQYLNSA